MGIPSESDDAWASRTISSSSILIPSPDESRSAGAIEEAVTHGFRNAAISAVAAAAITIPACRRIPWAKANLNHVAQALIVSAAGTCGFIITADKTLLHTAKNNTEWKTDKTT